jgi:hypothetical protein
MKFKTIVLAVFYVVSIKGSAQVTETTDTLTPLKMGEAYLSESKKIGVIT